VVVTPSKPTMASLVGPVNASGERAEYSYNCGYRDIATAP